MPNSTHVQPATDPLHVAGYVRLCLWPDRAFPAPLAMRLERALDEVALEPLALWRGIDRLAVAACAALDASDEHAPDADDPISRAWRRLTLEQRRVVLMRVWLGVGLDDSAHVLGLEPAALGAQLLQTSHALRSAVAADGIDAKRWAQTVRAWCDARTGVPARAATPAPADDPARPPAATVSTERTAGHSAAPAAGPVPSPSPTPASDAPVRTRAASIPRPAASNARRPLRHWRSAAVAAGLTVLAAAAYWLTRPATPPPQVLASGVVAESLDARAPAAALPASPVGSADFALLADEAPFALLADPAFAQWLSQQPETADAP